MAVSLSVQSLKTKSTSYGVKKVYEIYKTVKANIPAKFVKVTFGTNGFDIPQTAIALLIVGIIVGLSGLILSIFATATAGATGNPSPGTLAYNMTHPVVNGMVSFYNFFQTLYILLGVTGIVVIASGIIGVIMEKFKT